MIGHMILRKNIDGDDILGIKLVGGRLVANGRRGAIVERVKQGSIAELEGQIQPGEIEQPYQKPKTKISIQSFFTTAIRR